MTDLVVVVGYMGYGYVRAERKELYEAMCGEWRTDPPTEPGWYWAKEKNYSDLILVEVFISTGVILNVTTSGNENISELSDFSNWLGPLPLPEMPK